MDNNHEIAEGEAMIYASDEPDIGMLTEAYDSANIDLDEYYEVCRRSYDERRNYWPGKTDDMRKNDSNAFPWTGASDQEVNTIGERISTYVSLFLTALSKSHIKAFPTSMASLSRASMVSGFLKWMRSTYIPDFANHMELGANHLLEKGIMVTYVGWQRELRTHLQTVTLDDVAQQMPEVVEFILDGSDDEGVIAMIMQAMPHLGKKRAKKVVLDLRKTGSATIPVPRLSVDRPIVNSCAPDGEVMFPPYISDIQRSPWVFWKTYVTGQELEKKIITEGWDEEWVDNAQQNLRGRDSYMMEPKQKSSERMPIKDEGDLIMLLYAYQRLIDEDGAEGIYCTVFNPNAEGYAKHELMNGHDSYPFVVTRLSIDQRRLYETTNFTDILRGSQMQIKTERDSRIDRASMATLPPLMHPAGRPPSDWGPGVRLPYRRMGEIAWGPIPPADNGSGEIEVSMTLQADRAVGLDFNNPLSSVRQQFFVDKFLSHVRDVLNVAWKLYQRIGPDEVFFQVTGNPNPQTMTKGDPDETFSITVAFDTQSNDPEVAETQLKGMISLAQLDRNGIVDINKMLEFAASAINPVFADYVLQPVEAAQEKMMKSVTDDLAKLYAGIEVPAQANGAQIAMQIIQSYVQQPDVADRAQNDEAFGQRLQKYAGQYQFMQQQAQNAEIGKIGTAPAQMGGTQTQGMSQQ